MLLVQLQALLVAQLLLRMVDLAAGEHAEPLVDVCDDSNEWAAQVCLHPSPLPPPPPPPQRVLLQLPLLDHQLVARPAQPQTLAGRHAL